MVKLLYYFLLCGHGLQDQICFSKIGLNLFETEDDPKSFAHLYDLMASITVNRAEALECKKAYYVYIV
jgi:hypothetical protein